MAIAPVTRQQLENASRDADDLAKIVNGSAAQSPVVTRLGQQVKTPAKVIAEAEDSLSGSIAKAKAWASAPSANPVEGGLYSAKKYAEDAAQAASSFPTGGATGQVLTKKSNTNFDTEWKTPAAGGGSTAASTVAQLKALNPANVKTAVLTAVGLEGNFVLKQGSFPVGSDNENYYLSDTANYYWQREVLRPAIRSEYIAAFFRSDADTTIDLYSSVDGFAFEKLNGSPLVTSNGGGPVIGRDAGLFFFKGMWYIPITFYGYNNAEDHWDICIFRSKDLAVWEFVKVRLSGSGSPLYWEGGSRVGGTAPSNFIWAPKLFADGNDLYVAVSVRYNADVNDVNGQSVKHFRTFVSKCNNIANLTFDMAVKMNIGVDAFNTIDAQFYKIGGVWNVFVKNEYSKNIELWTCATLFGSYSQKTIIDFGPDVEAPCLVNIKRADGQSFMRLFADGYYTGLYFYKDSFDGGTTWGADQQIQSDYAMRHGGVLNLVDTDNPALADKIMSDFAIRARASARRAPVREINLGSGSVNLVPDDDVLYFITGSNVVTLNITSRGARRFFLAAKTGSGTAGINVAANARFPTARSVGFGQNNDRIIEVMLSPGTGGQYLFKG